MDAPGKILFDQSSLRMSTIFLGLKPAVTLTQKRGLCLTRCKISLEIRDVWMQPSSLH